MPITSLSFSGPYWRSMRRPLTCTPVNAPRSSSNTPDGVLNSRACSLLTRQPSSRTSFCPPLPITQSPAASIRRLAPLASSISICSIATLYWIDRGGSIDSPWARPMTSTSRTPDFS